MAYAEKTTLYDSSAAELGTASNPVRVNPTGTTTQPVSASSLPLPTGAATETTLSSINTNLGGDGSSPPAISGTGIRGWLRGIYEKLAATQNVSVTNASIAVTGTFYPATQPVSASSLPLPTGAATETTLSALNTKIPSSPATDRTTAASPASVRISNGSAFITPTTPSDTQPVSIAATVNTSLQPPTSGGLSIFSLVSAATTNATNLKASAGQVFGWYIYNSNTSARKVAFHNTAGTPTAGTSVLFSLVIPGSSGANVFNDLGIAFSTGIAITTVTGLAANDTTAVGANDLVISIFFK